MERRQYPAKIKNNEDRISISAAEWSKYANARAQIERWEAIRDAARAKIERKMGEHEIGTVAGVPVVEWKHTKSKADGGRFNQAKHKEAKPECHAEFTEVVEGRSFRPLALD